MTFDTFVVQPRCVAQRVVAADGDQVVKPQRLDVFQHLRGDVVDGGSDALLCALQTWGSCHLRRLGGSFFILAGLVRELCRKVPPVRSMVRVISRFSGKYVTRAAGRIFQVDVRQAFPPAADSDDFAVDLAAPDRPPI